MEWIEKTLGELGDIVGGATPSTKHEEYYGGNIAWITPKDLSLLKGRYISYGERSITEAGLASCSAQMMPPNAVLFTSRAPIGYVAIARQSVCTNQGFKSVVPHECVDSLFLYYLLKFNEERIEAMGSGTTFKEVSGKTMKAVQVRIPCKIEDQKKIASILDSIDSKIENNTKINDNLEQQAAAIFRSWFVDYVPFGGTAPDGWENVTLEDITALVSRGITPKYADDTDQIVINQKCIRNHMIDLSFARSHKPKVINDKWLQFGDLLINSTGDGTLGRAAQVWFQPHNLTVDSHVTIVRPAAENMIFYIGLWGTQHEKEIESLHTGSTGQTELPRDRVKALELLLPDKETLDRFNALIAPMAGAIVLNQEENNRLASIRDTLLPKLMSGEIDVSDVKL